MKIVLLVCHSAPVEQKFEVMPVVNVNRIGMSSEWSGDSKPAASTSQNEMKPWLRSKVRIKCLHWQMCDLLQVSAMIV